MEVDPSPTDVPVEGPAARPSGHISASSYPCHVAQQLQGHDGSVLAVRFTYNGQYCLTTGKDRLVKLWNPTTGLCIKTYKGHGNEVNDVAGARDNSKIISAGSDKMVFLWDVGTGQTITRFRGHAGKINSIKFNKESTVILSASYDATIKCWDMRSNNHEPIMSMNEAKDSIPSIDVCGWQVLSGSVDGRVRCYDLRVGAMYQDYLRDPVTSVAFSHDQNCVLASTLNSTIRLLDKETGELLSEYTGHKNDDYKLDSALSHNDAYVVSGSEDGDVCIWDLVSGNTVFRRKAHPSVVASIAYHPKKPLMISASVDGAVKVWSNTPALAG